MAEHQGDKMPENDASRARGSEGNPESQTHNRKVYEDIFIRNSLYPDPVSLFQFKPPELDKVKDQCIVALDTNVLLVPYLLGETSLKIINSVYKCLANEERLVVPAQVAREFVAMRPQKIIDILKTWNDLNSLIPDLKQHSFPILNETEEYKAYISSREETNSKLRDCKKAIAKIVELVRNWGLSDPVSELYRGIFDANVLIEPSVDQKQLRSDHESRLKHDVPPGYKDHRKPDLGIGDRLIWEAILSVGRLRKKPLVLVTGETKIDWVHTIGGVVIGPRYELIDEYRRNSDGSGFYVMRLADLLSMFGADQETIAEVRRIEADIPSVPGTGPVALYHRASLVREMKELENWARIVRHNFGIEKNAARLLFHVRTIKSLAENPPPDTPELGRIANEAHHLVMQASTIIKSYYKRFDIDHFNLIYKAMQEEVDLPEQIDLKKVDLEDFNKFIDNRFIPRILALRLQATGDMPIE